MTAPSDSPQPITREFLQQTGFAEMIRRAVPDAVILTDEERAASLASVLRARPAGGDGLWLFAYGSLIWNPVFHFVDRRVARIGGWHRAFCLVSRGGRGTVENPAMLLGLMPGGNCDGVAFRLAEEGLEAELDLIWRREMVTGAYIARWVEAADEAGQPFGQAIAFTINPDAPTFEGGLDEAELVRRTATARGPIGTAAEYLFNTRDGLARWGIADPLIDGLACKVEAELRR